MSSKADISAKIDDIFVKCTNASGGGGCADLKAIVRIFWPVLDNRVSLVDLAGVFTMCVPGNGNETLDLITFADFFQGIARIKYASGADFCEKMLAELANCAGIKIKSDLPLFNQVMDKNVIRILLKYNMPFRKAFSSFAGQNINVGGGLTWDEVQRLSIGMEVSGFTSFAGAHSLIPNTLSLHKCEGLARDVLTQFPVNAAGNSLNSALLFPQFEMLMCFTAVARCTALNRRNLNDNNLTTTKLQGMSTFARKVVEVEARPLHEMLQELIRDLSIDRSVYKADPGNDMGDDSNPLAALPVSDRSKMTSGNGTGSPAHGASISYSGKVVLPGSQRPENQYTGTISHSRHAQLLRLDALFEEVEAKVLPLLDAGSDVVSLLKTTSNGLGTGDISSDKDKGARLASKPVVIGDAVPVPPICPEPVEQLLQAALAHHNLGSYEESLKFLEASRMQLEDLSRKVLTAPEEEPAKGEEGNDEDGEPEHSEGEEETAAKKKAAKLKPKQAVPAPAPAPEQQKPLPIPLDLELYITLCKGNVYQSCGDDEQALLHYMDGWDRATTERDGDWEVVCLNSIGMLAYYSLRYDIALMCFASVAAFRVKAYGAGSADTATAWNNEAACMYCLGKRSESRLRFEKAWTVMCKILGHRAPRSVTAWKNLERSRRAAAAGVTTAETLAMRPDIDRLVLGGKFMVTATVPLEDSGKKKKSGGGKKGKKK